MLNSDMVECFTSITTSGEKKKFGYLADCDLASLAATLSLWRKFSVVNQRDNSYLRLFLSISVSSPSPDSTMCTFIFGQAKMPKGLG